ncbi:hypothetical protein ATKI12_8792 [Kitasatospora sp. Ki12]
MTENERQAPDGGMRQVLVKVRCDEDGTVVAPAADIGTMLRDIARSGWAGAGTVWTRRPLVVSART